MMRVGSGELRRAERLTDLVTAQLSAVSLGSCARDLCRFDLETPVVPGEIARSAGASTFCSSATCC